MAPSGWELGNTQGTKSIKLNKNCLSRVPKKDTLGSGQTYIGYTGLEQVRGQIQSGDNTGI